MTKTYGFTEARLRTSRYMPYVYSHVVSLIPVERPGLGTMGVDPHMRIYYDPAVFDEYTMDEAAFIILHEDMHVLLRHHARFKAHIGENFSKAEQDRWNIAADLAVNQTLRDVRCTTSNETGSDTLRLPVPEDALLPEHYGFDENLTVEAYYELLAQREEDQDKQPQECDGEDQGDGDADEQPQPGKGSGGSGADGVQRPWDDPPPGEDGAAEGMSDYDQQILERDVAEKTDEYHRKHRGDVPGRLARLAEETLRPKVDPFKQLHAAVKYAVTATTGRGDYTWRKMPRRQPPGGMRMPAPIQPVPWVDVLIDTSGSMSAKELAKALGVVERGLRSLPSGRIRVLTGDTCAQSVQTVFRPDQVTLAGGGGTNMTRLICEACDQKPAPDAMVVVTDGWTGWPTTPVRPRVVACLTEQPPERYPVPSWASKVMLHD